MHLFVTEFTREYLEDFSQLLYQGFSLAEIGHAFKNPDRIYRNINFIIQGMKRLHMSIAQQQAWTVRLLETVRQMKYGSIFNEDGKHIIFTPSQVADCMKKAEFTLPSQNDDSFPSTTMRCSLGLFRSTLFSGTRYSKINSWGLMS